MPNALKDSHTEKTSDQPKARAANKADKEARSRKVFRVSNFIAFIFIAAFALPLTMATSYYLKGGYGNVKFALWWGILAYVVFGVASFFAYNEYVVKPAKRLAATTVKTPPSSDRPWLAVDVTPAGPFVSKGDVIKLPVQYSIKNVGGFPANEVTIHARFFVTGIEDDPMKDQKELCDDLSRDPRPQISPIAVFPDQPPTLIGWEYSITKNENLIESISKSKVPVTILAGCVDYVFGEPATHHQTGFIYWVMRTNTKRTSSPVVVTIGEDTPKNRLVFRKHTGGGDYAN